MGEAVRDTQGLAIDWRYIDVNESWAKLVGVDANAARGAIALWAREAVALLDAPRAADFSAQRAQAERFYAPLGQIEAALFGRGAGGGGGCGAADCGGAR